MPIGEWAEYGCVVVSFGMTEREEKIVFDLQKSNREIEEERGRSNNSNHKVSSDLIGLRDWQKHACAYHQIVSKM